MRQMTAEQSPQTRGSGTTRAQVAHQSWAASGWGPLVGGLGSECIFEKRSRLGELIRAEVQLVSCAGDCLSRLFPGGKSLPGRVLHITVTVLLL